MYFSLFSQSAPNQMCIVIDGRAGGLLIGQSKDSVAEGRSLAADDFENCKVIANQNLQRSAHPFTGV